MRNKILNVIVLMAVLSPISVYALGLGELTLRSYLSQPLAAEVVLVGVESGDAEVIQARLASSEIHKKAGIERPFSLSVLKFVVEEAAGGLPFVRVYTEQSVSDPYFNFLIEVSGPDGRVFREYTLLLDPPPKPKAPSVAVTQVEIPQVVRNSTATGAVSNNSLAMPDVATIDGEEYGPTAIGDTLWEIALEVRPAGVNVNQAMIAIVAANPDAFINGNINRMLAGKVLRLPDETAYQALDITAARDEFVRQQDAWQEFKQNAPVVAPPLVVADSGNGEVIRDLQVESAPEVGQVAGSGRVRLVGADTASVTVGSSAGGVAQVTEHMELLEESLEVRERENQELREQIALLESQLATLREMAELANLVPDEAPAVIAEPVGAGGQDVDSVVEPTDKVIEVSSEAQPKVAVAEPVETPGAAEAVIEKSEPPVVAVQPVADEQERKRPSKAGPVKSSADDSGMLDLLIANWIYLAAGVGLLVLVLAGLALRGGKKNKTESINDLDLDDEEKTLVRTPGPAPAEQTPSAEFDATATVTTDSEVLEDTTSFLDDFVAPSVGVAAETELEDVDPIAEADVFITYGHHEQAEEIIQDAIQYDDRIELKLKLLDIFYSQEKGDEYEGYAEEIKELQSEDSATWEKIAALGHALKPDSELFSGSTLDVSQVGSLVVASTVQDELDLDAGSSDGADLELSGEVDNFDLGGDLDDLADLEGDLPQADSSPEAGELEGASSKESDEAIELDATEISTSIELDGFVGDEVAEVEDDLSIDDGGLEFDLSLDATPLESSGDVSAEAELGAGGIAEISTTMDLDTLASETSSEPEQTDEPDADEGNSLEFDLSPLEQDGDLAVEDAAAEPETDEEHTVDFGSLDFDDESPTEESSSTPQNAAPEVQIDEEAILDFELDITGDEESSADSAELEAGAIELDEAPALDIDDDSGLEFDGAVITDSNAADSEPLIDAGVEETLMLDQDSLESEASLEIQLDEIAEDGESEVELLDQELVSESTAEFTLEDGGLDLESGENLAIDIELDAANEPSEDASAELTIELGDVDADIDLDGTMDLESDADDDEAELSFDLDDELDAGLDETVISFASPDEETESETVQTLDAVASQLDLLAAYVDMGDRDQAAELNARIQQHGNDDQKQQAADLVTKLEE